MGARPHVRAGTSIYQSDGTRIVNLRSLSLSLSRRSSLSFGKSSTVINNLRPGSRSTQSAFREKLVRESKKKEKKNVSPQLFARRKSIKLSMQISLPLARRYIQINPFPIKFRSISLSTSIISYRRDFKTDFHFAFLSVQITLADLPPPSLFVPPYPSPSTFFIHGPAR